jgi:hypothetical protein
MSSSAEGGDSEMISPPPAQIRDWVQDMLMAIGVLYSADELARAEQAAASQEGAATDLSPEALLRLEAYNNLIRVVDRLERWASLVEHRQSRGQP